MACPLTQPTSPARLGTVWVRARHITTLNSPQPAHKVSMGLPLRPYSPPCDFKQPDLWVLLKPCLAGEGAINPALSQESCGRPGRLRAWGCSRPGPRTGPWDLTVLKQSPYRLFFQCPLYFLVSYLHKCWGTVGYSLCSSEDRLGVSPMCRGKWTELLPISPPSSSLGFLF